ncbi:hypothetical protein [Ureaplasma canigenitalium]|uniref:hypothetical protein n=1 Tax=Ureaplasma canigenitalium TaxID=42092 RepID=UPI0004E15C01|nr:hypothetical protein [Ureaplasma canigenitalium]
MKKHIKKTILTSIFISTSLAIFVPVIASCSNKKIIKEPSVNVFNPDDYVISLPDTDRGLTNNLFNEYDNFKQELITIDKYVNNYPTSSERIKNLKKNNKHYIFSHPGSKYKNLLVALDINNHHFLNWINKLTPNTLYVDFLSFLSNIKNTNERDDLVFSNTLPIVEVYHSMGEKKEPLSSNQPIFKQAEENSNKDFFDANKDIKAKVSFWYSFTNRGNSSVQINDPFTNNHLIISPNSTRKFFVEINNSSIKIDFRPTNRVAQRDEYGQTRNEANTYKLFYSFENFNVYDQEIIVEPNTKIGDQKKEKKNERQLHFTGDYSFFFNNYSYVLNDEIYSAAYNNNYFNLKDEANTYINKLNKETIKRQIEDQYETTYQVSKKLAHGFLNLLSDIKEEKTLKEVLKNSSTTFALLTNVLFKDKQLAELVGSFTKNDSLGNLFAVAKPILIELINSLPGLDDNVKSVILQRLGSFQFKEFLTNEITEIKSLLNSLNLPELAQFKPLITQVIDLINETEARSKRDGVGNYGAIDFIDNLITLLVNAARTLELSIKIPINGKEYTLKELVNLFKPVIDSILIKKKHIEEKDIESEGNYYEYYLSETKIIDLISLNTDGQVDYRIGLENITNALSKLGIIINPNILSILNQVIFKNINWTKEKIKTAIDVFLSPVIAENDSIKNIHDFIDNGVKKTRIGDFNLEYDKDNQQIKSLDLKHKYSLEASITFDISPLINLLPPSISSLISNDDTYQQIINELPRKFIFKKGDYVLHHTVVKNDKKILPYFFRDKNKSKHLNLGYRFFVTNEIIPYFGNTIEAFARSKSNNSSGFLNTENIAQALSLFLFKQQSYDSFLNINESLVDYNDSKNNEFINKLVNFKTNVYQSDTDIVFDRTKLTSSLINEIYSDIKTKKINEYTFKPDALGRQPVIYQARDTNNLTLDYLIEKKIIILGKNLKKEDINFSTLTFNIGLNGKQKNDEIEYDIAGLKKIYVSLKFNVPVVDLSIKENPKLVNELSFFI